MAAPPPPPPRPPAILKDFSANSGFRDLTETPFHISPKIGSQLFPHIRLTVNALAASLAKECGIALAYETEPHVYLVGVSAAQAIGGLPSPTLHLMVDGPPKAHPLTSQADAIGNAIIHVLRTQIIPNASSQLALDATTLMNTYQMDLQPTPDGWRCRLGPWIVIDFPRVATIGLEKGWQVSLHNGLGRYMTNYSAVTEISEFDSALTAVHHRHFIRAESQQILIPVIQAMAHGATIDLADWKKAQEQLAMEPLPALQEQWLIFQQSQDTCPRAALIDLFNLLLLAYQPKQPQLCQKAIEMWMHGSPQSDPIQLARLLRDHPNLIPHVLSWFHGAFLCTLAESEGQLQGWGLPFIESPLHPRAVAELPCRSGKKYLFLAAPDQAGAPWNTAHRFILGMLDLREQLKTFKREQLKLCNRDVCVFEPALEILGFLPLHTAQYSDGGTTVLNLFKSWAKPAIQAILFRHYPEQPRDLNTIPFMQEMVAHGWLNESVLPPDLASRLLGAYHHLLWSSKPKDLEIADDNFLGALHWIKQQPKPPYLIAVSFFNKCLQNPQFRQRAFVRLLTLKKPHFRWCAEIWTNYNLIPGIAKALIDHFPTLGKSSTQHQRQVWSNMCSLVIENYGDKLTKDDRHLLKNYHKTTHFKVWKQKDLKSKLNDLVAILNQPMNTSDLEPYFDTLLKEWHAFFVEQRPDYALSLLTIIRSLRDVRIKPLLAWQLFDWGTQNQLFDPQQIEAHHWESYNHSNSLDEKIQTMARIMAYSKASNTLSAPNAARCVKALQYLTNYHEESAHACVIQTMRELWDDPNSSTHVELLQVGSREIVDKCMQNQTPDHYCLALDIILLWLTHLGEDPNQFAPIVTTMLGVLPQLPPKWIQRHGEPPILSEIRTQIATQRLAEVVDSNLQQVLIQAWPALEESGSESDQDTE